MSRAALVTGAASGIGAAIVRQLAARGHRVGVLDRDMDGALRVADDICAEGGTAEAVEADVADPASVDAAVAAARAALGPLEIVVTAAGIAPNRHFPDITVDFWDRMFAVNVTGTVTCIQAVLPDMVASGWGRVVTISSSAGQMGTPHMVTYSASKGAVMSLTKALSQELAPQGITVNSISPGVIDTPLFHFTLDEAGVTDRGVVTRMVPTGRLGTADELAAVAAFLCSDEASYVTGQIIGVNGGLC
jgi:2-hydroxycyclohexanecarboxyl-CoA dehydrogenase